MKKIILSSLTILAVVALSLAPPSYADSRKNGFGVATSERIPTVYKDLIGGWWQYFSDIPVAVHPAEQPDGPVNCMVNQRGPVWFIPSTGPNFPDFIPRFYSCKIKQRALFFPLISQILFDDGTFFANVNEKRQFLLDSDDFWCRLSATVDGVPTNFSTPSILLQSDEFLYESGANGEFDIFGIPPGDLNDPETIAGGYFVLIPPLSRGNHVLNITGGVCDPDTGDLFVFLDNTYELEVIAGRKDRDGDDDDND